jgi:PAS domain S-box-containing protein
MTEDLRLQAVARFNDLDLENDPELLEILDLASAVSITPYALITFLDHDTEYLKVRKGITATSLPRELSFCIHSIQQNDLILVPDTKKDERFANSPLVTSEPGIRFYAGMPLTTHDGHNLGTLCVYDFETRTLSGHQQMVLKILANQVIKIMEIKLAQQLLEKNRKELIVQRQINIDANIKLRSFFESSTNFQVLMGKTGEVIDYNKSAYKFVKAVFDRKLQRGEQLLQYIHVDFADTFIERYQQALKGKKSLEEGETDYEKMGVIYWEAFFEPAFNDENEIIGVSYLIRNITERRLKEQKIISQNKSLLKIAHIQAHEFRAPLATIMGLMHLIKEENYVAPVEYFEYLEQAANQLDGTIRRIVKDIDEIVVDKEDGEY